MRKIGFLLCGILFCSVTYAQFAKNSFRVLDVFTIQDIKFYRLGEEDPSGLLLESGEEWVGLISKASGESYQIILEKAVLSGDFSLLTKEHSTSLVGKKYQGPASKLAKTYLTNTLQLEIKTVFAWLHLIGQERTEVALTFLEKLRDLERNTANIETVLAQQEQDDIVIHLTAITQLWTEISKLLEQLQNELVKEIPLKKYSKFTALMLRQNKERYTFFSKIFQHQWQEMDAASRIKFLAPFEERGEQKIVAEIELLKKDQADNATQLGKLKAEYQKKTQNWNALFEREFVQFCKIIRQKELTSLEEQQKDLLRVQEQKEKLALKLEQIVQYQEELNSLEQALENSKELPQHLQVVEKKLADILAAKEEKKRLEKELSLLTNIESEFQQLLYKLAACSKAKEQTAEKEKKQTTLKQELKTIEMPQAQKIKVISQNIVAWEKEKEQREALVQKNKRLNQEWKSWKEKLQQWEAKKHLLSEFQEKEALLKQKRNELPLEAYRGVPELLKKIAQAKEKLPVVRQSIQERINSQKEFHNLQGNLKQQEEKLLLLENEQQKLLESKKLLEEKELFLLNQKLEKVLQKTQQITTAEELLFQEWQTQQKKYQEIAAQYQAPKANETPLSVEVEKELALLQTLLLQRWYLLLLLAENRLTLNLVNPKFQTKTFASFCQENEVRRQKLNELKAWIGSQLKEKESFEFPVITTESWFQVLPKIQQVMQKVKKEEQLLWNQFQEKKLSLKQKYPSLQERLNLWCYSFYEKSFSFPLLWAGMEETRSFLKSKEGVELFLLQVQIREKWFQNQLEKAMLFKEKDSLTSKQSRQTYILGLVEARNTLLTQSTRVARATFQNFQEQFNKLEQYLKPLPSLQEEEKLLRKQIAEEGELEEKAKIFQQLLKDEEEIAQELNETQEQIKAFFEEKTNYLRLLKKENEMSELQQQISENQKQIDILPSLKAKIVQGNKSIELLKQEMVQIREQIQSKEKQVQQLSETLAQLEKIVQQESVLFEQKTKVTKQITQKKKLLQQLNSLSLKISQAAEFQKQKTLFENSLKKRKKNQERAASLRIEIANKEKLTEELKLCGSPETILPKTRKDIVAVKEKLLLLNKRLTK